jgi:hypothetical protein
MRAWVKGVEAGDICLTITAGNLILPPANRCGAVFIEMTGLKE